MKGTKERLLDAAAALIQTRGYSGFSFHDLAGAVGITTASIHYHFATKAVLGAAVVDRYTEAFFVAIGSPDSETPAVLLRRYIEAFRTTLTDDRNCLCGMLGAEISAVPEDASRAVRGFFAANEAWLAHVLRRLELPESEAKDLALLIIAGLEGALMIARASVERTTFNRVADRLLALTSLHRH